MSKSTRTSDLSTRQLRFHLPPGQQELDTLIRPIEAHAQLHGLCEASAALIVLEPPGTSSVRPEDRAGGQNVRSLERLAPLLIRTLAVNGFIFFFPPACVTGVHEQEDKIPHVFKSRRLIWVKSRAAHVPACLGIRQCHEPFFLLWPRERSQPVPHQSLPDVLQIAPDMSCDTSPGQGVRPVALFERLIKACTHAGELVVAPYAATGASVEAALRLERQVLGAELDPNALAKANERLARLRMDFFDDPVTAAFVNERGSEAL